MIKTKKLLLPILIGLVTLPRISVDLFLPSLTTIGILFHSNDNQLQLTLTSFMFGAAFCMLIAGPLSDCIGKKQVVSYSLGIFLTATIVAGTTDSIIILAIARFFQALGGSSGTLIARMMVKEYYSREHQIKALAHLSFAMATCPLITPLIGGFLQISLGWRSIFFVLGIIGIILSFAFMTQIDETQKTPQTFSLKELLQHYRFLLSHRLFIAYSLAIGFAWNNYCAFTVESPFLFQSLLGFDSIRYGILIALPVSGYLLGISLAKKHANRIGWNRLIFYATIVCLLGSSLLILLAYCFSIHWLMIIVPMIIVMVGVGIIIPCTQGAIMQPFPHIAGTASGLFFFIQMLMAGLGSFILQISAHHSAMPLALMIFGSSLILMVSFFFLTQRSLGDEALS